MDSNNHNNADADNREEEAKEQQQHKQPVVPQNAILAKGRKRKCQQTNDGQDAEEDELLHLQQPDGANKRNKDEYADDMELEGLSREELIRLLKEAKKESAAKHNKALTTKLECQPPNWTDKNVDDESSSSSSTNAQRDSLIQELSRQIVQLQEEKEENSKIIAEKSLQNDALHIQLHEMRPPQIPLPPRQMKVQLPFENWAELLGFVSRRELGEVVANVGNRHFAWLLQSFLHEYGEITLGSMEVLPPDKEFASGRPLIRTKIYMEYWKKIFFPVEHEPMPENIVNFHEIQLSYFDNSILNFLQQFKQKSLLSNVNLLISAEIPVDIAQILLIHLLPSIESINSITLWNITSWNRFYDYAGNANHPILVEMLPMARILHLSFNQGVGLSPLNADKIELCYRWLYTPREDGKSRVLFLSAFSKITAISWFIERIKKDFLAANQPVSFLILLHCEEAHEELNFENAQTNERLEIKTLESNKKDWIYNTLLITHHPMALQRQCIEANVKEALEWTFKGASRKITMNNRETKIVM